jgi:hypothetical protein
MLETKTGYFGAFIVNVIHLILGIKLKTKTNKWNHSPSMEFLFFKTKIWWVSMGVWRKLIVSIQDRKLSYEFFLLWP